MIIQNWPGYFLITIVWIHRGIMGILKNSICLAGILLVFSANLFAQGLPMAKNIDITIEQNRAIIHYDIKSKVQGSIHNVSLQFLDEDYRLITPTLLTGDVGGDIPGEANRKIEWDIGNDVQLLGSNITPVLFVDWTSKQFSKAGGPRNALLSILVPGLGDYFVADHRMMTIKPYMRTLSSLGFIALGYWAGEQRYYAEGVYKTTAQLTAVYNDYGRRIGYETTYYEKYLEGDLQYQFFPGDREVLIGLGAAIWAADIIWVLARGTNNQKFINASSKGSDFHLGYVPGGAAMQFSYTF